METRDERNREIYLDTPFSGKIMGLPTVSSSSLADRFFANAQNDFDLNGFDGWGPWWRHSRQLEFGI